MLGWTAALTVRRTAKNTTAATATVASHMVCAQNELAGAPMLGSVGAVAGQGPPERAEPRNNSPTTVMATQVQMK
jgi:hypothetical protein